MENTTKEDILPQTKSLELEEDILEIFSTEKEKNISNNIFYVKIPYLKKYEFKRTYEKFSSHISNTSWNSNQYVLLGKSNLILVDFDNKDGINSLENFLTTLSEEEKIDLYNTSYEITGSEGYHFYFSLQGIELSINQNNQGLLGKGIDILHGNQVSFVDPTKFEEHENSYKFIKDFTHLTILPFWLKNRIENAKNNKKKNVAEFLPNPHNSIERTNILQALNKVKEKFQQGISSHESFTSLGMALKNEGFSYEDFSMLSNLATLERWNGYKNEGGYSWGTLEYLAEIVKEPKSTESFIFKDEESAIRFYNERYSVVNTGNDTLIYFKNSNYEKYRNKKTFLSQHEGQIFLENGKPVLAGKRWLNKTEVIIEMEYAPTLNINSQGIYRNNNGYLSLNTFRGYAVEPLENVDEEKLKPFIFFLKEIICNNSEEVYKWLTKFIAHMFQKPQEKPKKAVALSGEQGIGKSYLVEDILGRILGQDNFSISSDDEEISGGNNSRLVNKILVYRNEAGWNGSIKSKNALKRIIVGDTITRKEKYQISSEVKNYWRIFSDTNGDWKAPVEKGDRRWLVIQVSEKFKDDLVFWKKYQDDYKNDKVFLANILTYFMNIDITGFMQERIPNTEEREESIIFSSNNDKIIGYIKRLYDNDFYLDSHTEKFESGIPKDLIYKDYQIFANEYGKNPLGDSVFLKMIKKYIPSLHSIRKSINGKKLRYYEWTETNDEIINRVNKIFGFNILKEEE